MGATVTDLLGLRSENDLGLVQVLLRALIVFLAALALVRIAHKRFFAKKNAFDVILAFILASMLARSINGKEPLFATIAAGFFLVLLHRGMSWVGFRFRRFDDLIKGHRNKVIDGGRIVEQVLKDHCVTHEDLEEQLRLRKIDDPQKVETAYLERSGEVSVIPR
jgi:uncharacterized membrane protein YcaP (DUF421 family)